MYNDCSDNDRMLFCLTKFTAFNEHVKVTQMKEQIKMFGVAADIFGEQIIPFIPKILLNLTKLIKEEATARLHVSISDTLGELVHYTVEDMANQDEIQNLFDNQYIKFIFSLLDCKIKFA